MLIPGRAAVTVSAAEIMSLASTNQCETLQTLEVAFVFQARDKYGSTALHYAAGGGALEACQYLIHTVAIDPYTTSSNNGRTALHWAARNGHSDICCLLARHVDIDVPAKGQVTPLQLAMWQGHLDTCQCLVKGGANPHFVNAWGCGVSHWLAKCPNHDWNTDPPQNGLWICCEWLWGKCHVSWDTPNHHGQTPLHKAAFAGNLPVVQYLVQNHGVLDSDMDHQGNTAADCAERNHQTAMAHWIRRHASPMRRQALQTLLVTLNGPRNPNQGPSSSLKAAAAFVTIASNDDNNNNYMDMPSRLDLKSIYHHLVKKWHPDRTKHSGSNHEFWNALQDAYQLLVEWWEHLSLYDTKIRLLTRNAALNDYPALLWLPEWHGQFSKPQLSSTVATTTTRNTCIAEPVDQDETADSRLASFERRLVSLLLTAAHRDVGLSLAQLPKEYKKNWHSIVNPKDYQCRKWVDLLQGLSSIHVVIDPRKIQQPRIFAKIAVRNS